MLHYSDWFFLVGMLSFAAFVSYLVHEVGCAIHNYLEDL
jgi:hypothetical protein